MNLISRLIRADETRKTRFHTGNGHLCIQPVQMIRAFGSTIGRVGFGRYARSPWLVYSAISHLSPRIAGKRVFEYGSGMSTLWFSDHAGEVIAVESNPEWYNRVRRFTASLKRTQVTLADSKDEYVNAISRVGGQFDVVLIDGMYRIDCVIAVRNYLRQGGLVIVDNTDVEPMLAETVAERFADSRLLFFRGWVPGNLHPNETTIIDEIPLKTS